MYPVGEWKQTEKKKKCLHRYVEAGKREPPTHPRGGGDNMRPQVNNVKWWLRLDFMYLVATAVGLSVRALW